MADLPIKLKIADREYPMKVAADDEERIRRAGREINERMKSYQERFKLDDKQDLLAMVAFDAFMERSRHESQRQETEKAISDRLSAWEALLGEALQE